MGQLKEGSFDNPKGFYENKRVVQINEELLSLLGQSWESTIALPDNWLAIDQIQALKATIKTFIKKEFKSHELFALKDPRFSLTLPLWKEVFSELGIAVKQFILVRHPDEVANSLYKRNHIAQTKGMALWMKYMINAELNARGDLRNFINYQDFLKDPVTIIQSLDIDFEGITTKLEKTAHSLQ